MGTPRECHGREPHSQVTGCFPYKDYSASKTAFFPSSPSAAIEMCPRRESNLVYDHRKVSCIHHTPASLSARQVDALFVRRAPRFLAAVDMLERETDLIGAYYLERGSRRSFSTQEEKRAEKPG